MLRDKKTEFDHLKHLVDSADLKMQRDFDIQSSGLFALRINSLSSVHAYVLILLFLYCLFDMVVICVVYTFSFG